MRQVKVRLQLAGTSFAALEDDAALAGTPRLTEERRLYFDAAGGALAAAGAGLCICQRAGRSVQVLELPGSNREWPVPGPCRCWSRAGRCWPCWARARATWS
ncbi:hypothetical protein DPM13_13055 [Paracoccus mutanolyticus]|uniref:CYTH domain-containing protein n=1 Tax=Paracoccus mutanolyticus TaxID=1499308 RepID=A0ABM6WT02_9RHOB|nr:hypothetical protein [Paracoccus mutanolyticus]AWX93676.1 hypothetical protein DPM13_13055 [Paracoccus mutanolyticus]